MQSSDKLYKDYVSALQKVADVKYASAVLQWDQETYLPTKGNDARGRQIATLSELAHNLFTDEKNGALLQELSGRQDLSPENKRNVELSLEDYNRSKKFTPEFVRKMSEVVNKSFHAWIQARKENRFSVFDQPLAEVIDLKKQEADILGYEVHPYDALMNDYDKGFTVSVADKLFDSLKPALKVLLDKIGNCKQVNNEFLYNTYPKEIQWQFGLDILKKMGYDFDAGRQDISEHPFTINFSSNDVRVTTRIDEKDLGNMIWSCIHEGGHALYEQGLPEDQYGLPLGEYCSLSIHESQSRLWENCIGRSMYFWNDNYQKLQTAFPEQLQHVTPDEFYKGINKVSPSLIRTEADELTYHFHIMIRYEIEKMLIDGSLKARDIPGYWNEMYKKYLGIIVPDDVQGCLQDVHWSHGSLGYFATYSTGSLYAAQLFNKIKQEYPDTERSVSNGDLSAIQSWLKQHIYKYGRYYRSEDLCTNATGEPLNSQYFIDYATEKYSKIYVS